MVTSEVYKLVGFVGGGIVLAVVGQMYSFKKKKEREEKKLRESDPNYYNNDNDSADAFSGGDSPMSEEEKKAKDYIEQYKSEYTKEAIVLGLHNFGISDDDAQQYVEKYF